MFNFETLPKTLKEARDNGSQFYYTGKPCKHGHLAPKNAVKSYCLCCKSKKNEDQIKEWFFRRRDYGDYHKLNSLKYWSDKGQKEPKIISKKEAIESNLVRYYTGLPCPKNHYDERYTSNGGCVVCSYEEQVTEHAKKRYNKWYIENRERKLEKCKEYNKQNYLKKKEYINEWKKNNKDKISVYSLRANSRRLVNIEKSAPLVDSEFFELFTFEIEDKRKYLEAITKTKWNVDHIVPLKGKTVCGLHVPCNMQLLPRIENLRKGNRVWPDMP